ncbi:MAG: hypothetical protein CMK92_02545 [Pseudomonas sp.]|nr:hypothetical protein [Pseudomonas sp.]
MSSTDGYRSYQTSNSGGLSALEMFTYVLLLLILILLVVVITMYATEINKTPVSSESFYKYTSVPTKIEDMPNISAYVKIGLKDGVNQNTIPTKETIEELIGRVLNNEVAYPPQSTTLNLYAQAVGNDIYNIGAVSAVSVQLQEQGDNSDGGTFTKGHTIPMFATDFVTPVVPTP